MPRDQLFAFGGLNSTSHNDDLAVKPDCGLYVWDLQIMFAVRARQTSQNLDILGVPRVQQISIRGGLPT